MKYHRKFSIIASEVIIYRDNYFCKDAKENDSSYAQFQTDANEEPNQSTPAAAVPQLLVDCQRGDIEMTVNPVYDRMRFQISAEVASKQLRVRQWAASAAAALDMVGDGGMSSVDCSNSSVDNCDRYANDLHVSIKLTRLVANLFVCLLT